MELFNREVVDNLCTRILRFFYKTLLLVKIVVPKIHKALAERMNDFKVSMNR